MKKRVHAVAGAVGLILITTFFVTTLAVELVGDEDAIARVKSLILIGICVVVPSMAATGGTGNLLSRNKKAPAVRRKLRRMIAIGSIGLLVLVPCAVILQRLAADRDFGAVFYAVQALELVGGAVNITLMSLNFRDGLVLSGRWKRRAVAVNPR